MRGAADEQSFLEVGRQCAEDIVAGLKRIGRAPDSFESVLDFGCGCGRVLRWLAPELTPARVFGTDIDRQAVAWCSKNLPGIAFSVNAGLPPTGYAAQSFDLIYAISVFSHLDEDFQFCLEQSIETKNQHILRLEQLIRAIEAGRVMRLLR